MGFLAPNFIASY